MDSTRTLACVAVLLCMLWLAVYVAMLPVWAVPPLPAPAPQAAGPVTLAQATARVLARYRGRVVRTETRDTDGHTLYIIRILSDSGHVRTVRVDAQSGAIR